MGLSEWAEMAVDSMMGRVEGMREVGEEAELEMEMRQGETKTRRDEEGAGWGEVRTKKRIGANCNSQRSMFSNLDFYCFSILADNTCYMDCVIKSFLATHTQV